jgi:hypothetical protein
LKTTVLSFLTILFILGFSACRPAHDYARYVKELDSLKVVTEQAVDNFTTVDSLACYTAYSKERSYRLFIESHVHDTVPKETAEALTGFFSTEKALADYLAMRPVWLSEARAVIRQVGLLSNDLSNGSIEPAEAVEFISTEKKRSEKIIEELKTNTMLIRKHLELHNRHLPVVEQILKSYNAGILPAISQEEKQS